MVGKNDPRGQRSSSCYGRSSGLHHRRVLPHRHLPVPMPPAAIARSDSLASLPGHARDTRPARTLARTCPCPARCASPAEAPALPGGRLGRPAQALLTGPRLPVPGPASAKASSPRASRQAARTPLVGPAPARGPSRAKPRARCAARQPSHAKHGNHADSSLTPRRLHANPSPTLAKHGNHADSSLTPRRLHANPSPTLAKHTACQKSGPRAAFFASGEKTRGPTRWRPTLTP